MPERAATEAGAAAPLVMAVVVTFHPDASVLGALLERLAAEKVATIVIDNTPGGDPRAGEGAITLGRNTGVAHALNVGIAEAWRRGATHALLCDQDSLPGPGMVAALLQAENELLRRGVPVAAVGPSYVDFHSGAPRAFKVSGRILPRYVRPRTVDPAFDVLTLITAGMLMRRAMFDAIGGMRDELFIDRVDTEWCLRARRLGVLPYAVPSAALMQRMGERVLRFPGFPGISVYAPERIYYQLRNLVFLWREGTLGVGLTMVAAGNTFAVLAARLAAGPRRVDTVHLALRGFMDGLSGRLGELR